MVKKINANEQETLVRWDEHEKQQIANKRRGKTIRMNRRVNLIHRPPYFLRSQNAPKSKGVFKPKSRCEHTARMNP